MGGEPGGGGGPGAKPPHLGHGVQGWSVGLAPGLGHGVQGGSGGLAPRFSPQRTRGVRGACPPV